MGTGWEDGSVIPVAGHEAMGTEANTKNTISTDEKLFLRWEWSGTGPGCLRRLCWYPKPGWMWPEKPALADPVLSWGLDVQGSLPPPTPLGSAVWMGLSSNSRSDLHHWKGWTWSKTLKEKIIFITFFVLWTNLVACKICYNLSFVTVKHCGSTVDKYFFLWTCCGCLYVNYNILHLGIIVIINTDVNEMLILANPSNDEML